MIMTKLNHKNYSRSPKLTLCHSVVPQKTSAPQSGSSFAFFASVELPLDPFSSAGRLDASMIIVS